MRIATNWTRVGLAGALALGVALVGTEQAEAQSVNAQGQAPVTDVSGTIITSGDMVAGMLAGQPGTVQTFFCPEATGVRNAGHLLLAELNQGLVWAVTQAPGVRVASAGGVAVTGGAEERQFLLSAALQDDLVELLTAGDDRRPAARSIEAGLTPPSNPSRGAQRAARDLVRDLEGLAEATSAMDVHDPGHKVPTHLTRTVARYNAFINASSEEFLRNPTEELLAVEAVLSRYIVAAMDHHGDESACGGPVPASPEAPVAEEPPPPPAPERATSICLFTDGDLRNVTAIHLPLTGETLVAVNGERKPVSEVYPLDPALSRGAELAAQDEPVKFGEREYLKFGLPHAVNPDELTRGGEVDGVSVFHPRGGEAPPEVIYVPVGEGCLAQPFQRQELVRQVQG